MDAHVDDDAAAILAMPPGGDDDEFAAAGRVLRHQEGTPDRAAVDQRLAEAVDRVTAVVFGDGELAPGFTARLRPV